MLGYRAKYDRSMLNSMSRTKLGPLESHTLAKLPKILMICPGSISYRSTKFRWNPCTEFLSCSDTFIHTRTRTHIAHLR